MFDLIASVLAWFYELVPNYGVAIILLTLTVMLILTPLTLKGTRSMIAMQRLQPEMRKLQAQYKDDRQKLNEELLKFYKEHKINPVGGCLPLLLQMPVFIVLYRVIRGLTNTGPGVVLGSVLAGGEAHRFFRPDYLDQSSQLFQDLSQTDKMQAFGINLADSASKALADGGFVHALPLLILILFVAASSYVQQKQVSGRNPNAQINPQQQMLLRLMPAFFAFISLGLPGGVVLYFFVSNLYRMGQQAFITRTMYRDGTMVIDVPSTEAKPSKAGASPTKAAAIETTSKPKPAAKAPAKPAQRTPLFGRVTGDGARKAASAPKPAARSAQGSTSSGRAQPAGSQPRPRKKKRK